MRFNKLLLLYNQSQSLSDPASAIHPRSLANPSLASALPQLKSFNLSSCQRQDIIDVNLGNSWPEFLNAAYCQITGRLPSDSQLATLPYRPSHPRTRRIDVIRYICIQAGRSCPLSYSDPWLNGDSDLSQSLPVCQKKVRRNLGAVFMFFFNCPNEPNCHMDWANSHVYGMKSQSNRYGGFYHPENPGFWMKEISDAVYAGFQFLLLNTYGPDLFYRPQIYAHMNDALARFNGTMKFGLMDDTWIWGTGYGGPDFATIPNVTDTEAAASELYLKKWKPFFRNLNRKFWYTVRGRPVIQFYNAGTLKPAKDVTPVVYRMKQLFLADFGVTPFVILDVAFPAGNAADATFKWDTFSIPERLYRSSVSSFGLSFYNFMPRWDSKGRDSPGQLLTSSDRLLKGPELLQANLDLTASKDIVVIATWNDLGEGTGINRHYDYYYLANWLSPTYFMDITRRAQCA